ncbi:DUF4139 domain-containing protein [Rhodocyclus tenuis]|uniref:DUF4139 domain-containing protein n=1 Tax=Rhodocyclus gracilis TaxID=2929842 RepID=A0ABX0WH71_9RHOO|nr:DUF4139 domain-containing protein [Rhodocyclus gracilis]NJA88208.1 DUF4139 domain-containing protein [Rhodocyclus gracilis]
MRMRGLLAIGMLLASGASAQSVAGEASGERVAAASEREATAITVYNDDLALVRERRRVSLPAGVVRLAWREVSGQIRPETAALQAVDGARLSVLEQNFDFDLLTPEKLLEKYVGREVTVLRTPRAAADESRERATVLSANNGVVLRFADRVETGVPGRLLFDAVPPSLRDRPTLTMLLDTAGGARSLELSYLTGGLGWHADYVANLSADARHMDLAGWVTLTNSSGAAYEDVQLQLVAGTPNRVREMAPLRAVMMAAGARAKTDVVEESLLDYHLYRIARPTSIADNQTKQLALLSAAAVPVRHEYVLAGSEAIFRGRAGSGVEKLKPAVFIEFANRGGDLGVPLPAGVVRVYARDRQGAAQFVGEDRLAHTAKNETVRVRLGEAFDLNAERRQAAFRTLAEGKIEAAVHYELRNARDEAVTVRVQESVPGDAEIVQQSRPGSRESAQLAVWIMEVPANGTAALDYSLRFRAPAAER